MAFMNYYPSEFTVEFLLLYNTSRYCSIANLPTVSESHFKMIFLLGTIIIKFCLIILSTALVYTAYNMYNKYLVSCITNFSTIDKLKRQVDASTKK